MKIYLKEESVNNVKIYSGENKSRLVVDLEYRKKKKNNSLSLKSKGRSSNNKSNLI